MTKTLFVHPSKMTPIYKPAFLSFCWFLCTVTPLSGSDVDMFASALQSLALRRQMRWIKLRCYDSLIYTYTVRL